MSILEFISLGHALALLGIKAKEHPNYFTAHCPSPSHVDKNPSWTIYKDTGHHVCFSCGYSGSFHQLVKDLTGQNAYKFFNIQNVESHFFKESLKDNKKRDSFPEAPNKKGIFSVVGDMLDCYSNDDVIEYLNSRNITEEFVEYYDLSYCRQAIINKNEPVYIDRLCIPIYYKGELVNIEGRDFTRKQSKKVLYPHNTDKIALFDYDRLDKSKPLIVTEGIMDLPTLFNLGYRNLTCTYGINVSSIQKDMLNEFDEVWLFSDGDEAGRKMITEFDEFMDKEFYVVRIEGKDPGEATKDEIKNAIKNKLSSVEFFIDKSGIFNREENVNWE